MSATDSLLAKLGPKVAKIPAGEKRVSAGLMTGEKTMRKVRAAMSLATIGGVEASTRVHGSQTQSMDYDALSPQDVAAALGFIRDPLAREVFCLARWPGYAERDISETRVLILRRVMDEGQRAVSDLAFATLYGFNPSLVLELSATPIDAASALIMGMPRLENWLISAVIKRPEAEAVPKR